MEAEGPNVMTVRGRLCCARRARFAMFARATLAILPLIVPLAWSAASTDAAPGNVASTDREPGNAAVKIDGIWQGTLQDELRLVLKVTRRSDGGLKGTLDSPDQGALGLEIDRLTFDQGELRFEMQRLVASFAGKINETGSQIAGEWKQGGFTLPLTFKRVEKAPELRRPQVPVKPYPYQEEEVSYPNRKAGITLAGTFTMPSGKGPFPAVLLITGSGPEDRDEAVFGHRPFLILADYLTRKGIAVLRVDDRGFGKSTGAFAGATSEDFAEDALAGVDYLKSRREIHPREIGLVGHSEGGIIAPMVASRSRDVAYVVLLAASGVPGDEFLMLQSAAIRRSVGASEEYIAKDRDLQRRLYGVLKQERDSTAAAEKLAPIVEELIGASPASLPDTAVRKALVRTQIETFLSPWFRFVIAYDPRPSLTRLTCPLLALNGEKDVQVTPKENLGAIAVALKAGVNRDYRVKELPGLNHLFQTCTTGSLTEYAQIEETMSPVALDEIASWIRKHTLQRR